MVALFFFRGHSAGWWCSGLPLSGKFPRTNNMRSTITPAAAQMRCSLEWGYLRVLLSGQSWLPINPICPLDAVLRRIVAPFPAIAIFSAVAAAAQPRNMAHHEASAVDIGLVRPPLLALRSSDSSGHRPRRPKCFRCYLGGYWPQWRCGFQINIPLVYLCPPGAGGDCR